MITREYINSTDMAVLAEWLQTHLVPNYFDSVEYDTETTTTITCIKDGYTAFTITKPGLSYTFTAYKSATLSESSGNVSTQLTHACSCANGVFLLFGTTAGLIITKTNQDETAVIFSSANNLAWRTAGIRRVAWGDSQISNTLGFTALVTNQAQLIPFTTNCEYGGSSYTPAAFWLPESDARYDIPVKCIINGKQYLSNGYWAILDGEVTP